MPVFRIMVKNNYLGGYGMRGYRVDHCLLFGGLGAVKGYIFGRVVCRVFNLFR